MPQADEFAAILLLVLVLPLLELLLLPWMLAAGQRRPRPHFLWPQWHRLRHRRHVELQGLEDHGGLQA